MNQLKKTCSQCQQEKELTNFYKKGNAYDSLCKECKKAKRRLNYDDHRKLERKPQLDKVIKIMDILHDNELKNLTQFDLRLKEMLTYVSSKEVYQPQCSNF